MNLYKRKYLEEANERFWRICLKVARSNPHLCAEDVEFEAALITLGSKPEPKDK